VTAISANKRKTLGVFGGTFDPIHRAHLQMARELQQRLQLDEMRLLPCHIPPHRQAPGVSSEHRALMVALAIEEENSKSSDVKALSVDTRELKRDRRSYTIDTLKDLRDELGQSHSICLCMGMDSLASLDKWYCWHELLTYSHIVVAARPGYEIPEVGGLANWIKENRTSPEQLHKSSRGALVIEQCSLLAISATEIRIRIQDGKDISHLLPESIERFIKLEGLYKE